MDLFPFYPPTLRVVRPRLQVSREAVVQKSTPPSFPGTPVAPPGGGGGIYMPIPDVNRCWVVPLLGTAFFLGREA